MATKPKIGDIFVRAKDGAQYTGLSKMDGSRVTDQEVTRVRPGLERLSEDDRSLLLQAQREHGEYTYAKWLEIRLGDQFDAFWDRYKTAMGRNDISYELGALVLHDQRNNNGREAARRAVVGDQGQPVYI